MTETKSYKNYALAIVVLMSMAISSWPVGAETRSVGKVVLVTGKAAIHSISGELRKLRVGGVFYEGETIETHKESFVKLKYTDGGVMYLRPTTKIIIEEYKFTKDAVDKLVTNLVKGGLRTVTGDIAKRNRDNYKMKTPVATMGVYGTDFTVRFCNEDCTDLEAYGAPSPDNGLYMGVNKGGIVISNAASSQIYRVGQFGHVAGTQFKPRILPSAPAILVADNLPEPNENNSNNFIKDSSCK